MSKCEYAVVSGAYVELLLNTSSSNSSAHLYAYLPDGSYLGEGKTAVAADMDAQTRRFVSAMVSRREPGKILVVPGSN